jgi:lysozyme
MKRSYAIGAFVVGIGAAAFFLLQGSSSFDISQLFDVIKSWFRRGADQVSGTLSSDAYTKALGLIAGFEGFSAKAYPDADGFSIGYGHFITASDPYDSTSVIDEAMAYQLLSADAQSAKDCVESSVTVPLNANQEAALISFVYNVGCTAFQNSNLLSLLNSGDMAGAAEQFAVWNKSQGSVLQALVTRRTAEQDVFTS